MIWYIILTFSAIGDSDNAISPSKIIYHDIFQKEKNYDFLDGCTKGNGRQHLHAYILNVNFNNAFNITR